MLFEGDEPNEVLHSNEDSGAYVAFLSQVLSILKYSTEEEAIQIANDSEYGLGGSVWSTDIEHATSVARQIDTGTIGINGYMVDLNAPFGGVKASGLGREMGPESIGGYLQYKSIYLLG